MNNGTCSIDGSAEHWQNPPVMRSDFYQIARRGPVVLTIVALVQGGLVGAVMAAHDAHDPLGDDKRAAIELIVHGHEHEHGTPDHEHSFVSAKPAPLQLKRNDLLHPPYSATGSLPLWTPRIPLSLRDRTELCGPSPPSVSRTIVVLRI